MGRSRATFQAAFALGRHEVGARLGSRLGTVSTIVIAAIFGFAASSGLDLAAESNGGLVAGCLRWSAWLGAGPIALATSHDAGDPGLSALARLAGIESTHQALGRVVAAAQAMALRIAAPALVVCLAGVVRVPSFGWGGLALGASLSALVLGLALALVAVGCGRLAPGRGRSLLLAVVFLPYLAGQSATEGWSIPTVFGAVIDTLTGRLLA